MEIPINKKDLDLIIKAASGSTPVVFSDTQECMYGLDAALTVIGMNTEWTEEQKAQYRAISIQISLSERQPRYTQWTENDLVKATKKAVKGDDKSLIKHLRLARRAYDVSRKSWIEQIIEKENVARIELEDTPIYLLDYEEPELLSAIKENVCKAQQGDAHPNKKYVAFSQYLGKQRTSIISEFKERKMVIQPIHRMIDSFSAYGLLSLMNAVEGIPFDEEEARKVIQIEHHRATNSNSGDRERVCGEYFLRQQIKEQPEVGEILDRAHNRQMIYLNQLLLDRGLGPDETFLYHRGKALKVPLSTVEH